MANMGLIPAGSYANREHSGKRVFVIPELGQFAEDIVFDPQTSGGLLISIPEKHSAWFIGELVCGGFDGDAPNSPWQPDSFEKIILICSIPV